MNTIILVRMSYLSNCLFFILQALVWKGCLCQNSNGDSILYLNGIRDLSNTEGVLQVYVDRWHELDFSGGKWINVCSEQFNRGAAAAACRQLGYTDAIDYGPYQNFNYELNPNISEYVLTEALCPSVSDYTIYGETHLLRCSYYATIVNSSDIHCTPVGLQCVTTLLTANPYNGQITLMNRTGNFQYSISSGYLSMYYKGAWYPVCGNVSYFGSVSACRQLGSTSVSNTYTDRRITAQGLQLGDPSCLSDTFQCTDHCYNETHYQVNSQCNPVLLVCRFLIKNGPAMSSGSQSVCQLLSSQSESGNTESLCHSSVGLSISLGFMTTVASVMTLATIILSVWLYCSKHRSSYKELIQ